MKTYTLDKKVNDVYDKSKPWIDEPADSQSQNLYAGHIEEILEKNKWIEDDVPYIKEQLALIVENQSLARDIVNESPYYKDTDLITFNKIVLPLVYRMYKKSVLFDLVSVQTLLGPCSIFRYESLEGKLLQRNWVAKSRKMKAFWNLESQSDMKMVCGMDPLVELTCILAQEMGLELVREVLTDLKNNAGTMISFQNKDGLLAIEKTNKIIDSKIGHEANWIVTGKDEGGLVDQLRASSEYESYEENPFTSSIGIQKIGRLSNKWDVYCDGLYPANSFLMGYKGDNYQAGYFYGPYVAVTPTPVVIDPDSFCPRRGILARYAKSLVYKDFYARVKLER